MTHCVQDSRIQRKGKHSLITLNEVVKSIQELETSFDGIHVTALSHCEDCLMNVMIDLASILSDGAPWSVLRQMLRDAGVAIPEDLDHDLASIQ